ncbi:MAG: DUF4266 domain-containing protein [Pseudomonadota bacterium]
MQNTIVTAAFRPAAGQRWRRALALAAALAMAACATRAPVQPWQKGTLAKPEMRFDAAPAKDGLAEHVYSSREGASGGSGAAGGGCGCN